MGEVGADGCASFDTFDYVCDFVRLYDHWDRIVAKATLRGVHEAVNFGREDVEL